MTDRRSSATSPLPRHGGALVDASRRYGIPSSDWLDLSTGINPIAYPLPLPDVVDSQRLPDPADLAALITAARDAYGARADCAVLAAPGSDLALRLLPLLEPRTAVAIVAPTYGGHAEAWQAAGHSVETTSDLETAARAGPVVVVTNPNNPDGRIAPTGQLRAVAADGRPGRLLVVDEAYGELTPGASLVPHLPDNAIILRSFGKFYGLAGLRLGFVLGSTDRLAPLARLLGDWPVSAMAIAAGRAALGDRIWQDETRSRLAVDRHRLDRILATAGLQAIDGTDLFRYVPHPAAPALHTALARRGVWTRIFDHDPRRLRIGLPRPDAFARLEHALDGAMAEIAARES